MKGDAVNDIKTLSSPHNNEEDEGEGQATQRYSTANESQHLH